MIYTAQIILIYLLFWLNIPWFPKIELARDLDSSWLLVLHHAFINKLQFGSDIIWHYGPLGFLYTKFYHPDTRFYMLLGWLLLSTIAFLTLRKKIIQEPKQCKTVIIIAALVSFTDDCFFILFPLLIITEHFCYSYKTDLLKILLIFSLAVISLVKASYFFLSLTTIILIEIDHATRSRQFGTTSLIYLGSFLTLWLLLGQQFALLLPFITGQYELSRGFTAMATFNRSPLYLILYLILMFAWNAILFTHLAKYRGNKGAILAYLTVWWIALKIGFLQSNEHHLTESLAIALVTICLTKELVWNAASKYLKLLTLASYCGLSTLLVQNFLHYPSLKQFPFKAHKVVSQAPKPTLEERYQNHVTKLREGIKLPASIDDDADIISYDQVDLLLANYSYNPRPIFQSYHVYTPYLANKNCHKLTSSQAAKNLFITISPVLGRFPTIEEGSCLPLLLSHYDLQKVTGNHLHLTRAKSPKEYSFTRIEAKTTSFNKSITVPNSTHPLWVSVEIEPSLLGRLADLLLTNIPIYINFETVTGYQRSDRLITNTAKEGFLLSPLIDNHLHLAQLLAGGKSNNQIASFSITTNTIFRNLLKWLFKNHIKVQFYTLKFASNASISPLPEREQTYAELTSNMLNSKAASSSEVIDRHISIAASQEDYIIKIYQEAVFQLSNKRFLSFSYGNFKPFHHLEYQQQPVNFKITGVTLHNEPVLLWQDIITDTRVDHHTQILIPKEYSYLLLEIKPMQDAYQSWSFISNFKAH